MLVGTPKDLSPPAAQGVMAVQGNTNLKSKHLGWVLSSEKPRRISKLKVALGNRFPFPNIFFFSERIEVRHHKGCKGSIK